MPIYIAMAKAMAMAIAMAKVMAMEMAMTLAKTMARAMAKALAKGIAKAIVFEITKKLRMGFCIMENLSGAQESISNLFRNPYHLDFSPNMAWSWPGHAGRWHLPVWATAPEKRKSTLTYEL